MTKTLLSAFLAATILGVAAMAMPVMADPARATVHGAYPLYEPSNPTFNGDEEYLDNYGGFYGDPLSQYYDPAGAMPDWRYHGPAAVDLVLARTLDRTGESMLGHMLICQSRHATYSAASNTYYGRHGIPVACQD